MKLKRPRYKTPLREKKDALTTISLKHDLASMGENDLADLNNDFNYYSRRYKTVKATILYNNNSSKFHLYNLSSRLVDIININKADLMTIINLTISHKIPFKLTYIQKLVDTIKLKTDVADLVQGINGKPNV